VEKWKADILLIAILDVSRCVKSDAFVLSWKVLNIYVCTEELRNTATLVLQSVQLPDII